MAEASTLLAVEGLHCGACVSRVEQLLASQHVAGEVDLATRALNVRLAPDDPLLSGLCRAMAAAGFPVRRLTEAADSDASPASRRRGLARIGVAIIGAMQVMMLAWPDYFGAGVDPALSTLFRWGQWLIATPVVVWAGAPFFHGAVGALRGGHLNMDVPVALSLTIAWGASSVRTFLGSGELYFDAATMFVALLLIGRHWEAATRARAVAHLQRLASAIPATAERLGDGGTRETVPVAALRAGDRVQVAPGEALPVDGCLETDAELDEALLTGESLPVLRRAGEAALAGSLNQGRMPLRLRTVQGGEATQVAGILRLLQRAAARKPAVQRLADRVAGHFTFAVLALAATGAALAALRGDPVLPVVIAVLVASCPCALSLAVPTALAAGTSRLAARGVLVARADRLPRLAEVDTVLFDKTGTLTGATLVIRAQQSAGWPLPQAGAIAAALEAGLAHPIARAFAAVADGRSAEGLQVTPGLGVSGTVDGQAWSLGPAAAAVARANPALTWITLSDPTGPRMHFGLGAAVREDAPAVVAQLRGEGRAVALLTGDSAGAAAAVAASCGIDAVAARQRPEHKLAVLRALQAQGRVVMAVGDGLNDAPFLAAADVSVALPGGAAATQARADLILVGDRLDALPLAMRTATLVRRRMRQNLAWAVLYNLSVLPMAMVGWLPPWLAAAGMSVSSLWVVANALRLPLPE
jgi:P-type Cu2+ transporter